MAKVSMDPLLEQKLIKNCKKDKKAFEELYVYYNKPILNFIRSRVTDDELAKDLTSVVFKKAFEAIDAFKWQGVSFSAWLYRISRNTIIDQYRSDSRKSTVSLNDRDFPSGEKSPEESFENLDFEEQVRRLLADLPEKERKIIYMKFFEGYTNNTIANLTDLSETNVGTIIHRTVAKLRAKL